jgi:hypothetical protein
MTGSKSVQTFGRAPGVSMNIAAVIGVAARAAFPDHEILGPIPDRRHVADDHGVDIEADKAIAQEAAGARGEQAQAAIAARVAAAARIVDAGEILPELEHLNIGFGEPGRVVGYEHEAVRLLIVPAHHPAQHVDVRCRTSIDSLALASRER